MCKMPQAIFRVITLQPFYPESENDTKAVRDLDSAAIQALTSPSDQQPAQLVMGFGVDTHKLCIKIGIFQTLQDWKTWAHK